MPSASQLATAFAAFAIMSVYTAFSAGFVAGTLHRNSHLLAGTVAFALAAAAAISQVTTSRLSLRARQRGGLAAGAMGFILLAIGVADKSLTIFLLAGIIGGAGSGMLLPSAIGVVAAVAAPESPARRSPDCSCSATPAWRCPPSVSDSPSSMSP